MPMLGRIHQRRLIPIWSVSIVANVRCHTLGEQRLHRFCIALHGCLKKSNFAFVQPSCCRLRGSTVTCCLFSHKSRWLNRGRPNPSVTASISPSEGSLQCHCTP